MKGKLQKKHLLSARTAQRLLNGSAAEQAGVFSFHHIFEPNRPIARAELEQAAVDLLRSAAQRSALDGIIPGHLKLLLQSGETGLVLSMTRLDEIDRRCIGGWDEIDVLESYQLTVNFLLLTPLKFDESEIVNKMDPAACQSSASK